MTKKSEASQAGCGDSQFEMSKFKRTWNDTRGPRILGGGENEIPHNGMASVAFAHPLRNSGIVASIQQRHAVDRRWYLCLL